MKSFLILFSLIFSTNATAAFVDFHYDLSNGMIDIEPTLPYISNDGSFNMVKGSCRGVCLGGPANPTATQNQIAAENAYLFIEGDPDGMNLILYTFTCTGPYLVGLQHLQTGYKLFEGDFSLSWTLGTGRAVIGGLLANYYPTVGALFKGINEYRQNTMPTGDLGFYMEHPHDYVNYACTDEFRTKFGGSRLSELKKSPRAFGQYFSVDYASSKIQIRWDAKNYKDGLTREIEATLLYGTQVLERARQRELEREHILKEKGLTE